MSLEARWPAASALRSAITGLRSGLKLQCDSYSWFSVAMLIYGSSGPLQPLVCRQRTVSRAVRATVSLRRPRHRLYGPVQPHGAQPVLLVRAHHEDAGPVREPEEPRTVHAGAVAARQLLSVTALAFFTVSADLLGPTNCSALANACIQHTSCIRPDSYAQNLT